MILKLVGNIILVLSSQVPGRALESLLHVGYFLHRSQDGYCEYMADGTKALLLKKIFSEAEKVLQDYDDGHCT